MDEIRYVDENKALILLCSNNLEGLRWKVEIFCIQINDNPLLSQMNIVDKSSSC